MRLNRRGVLKAGIGVGASLLLPSTDLFAQRGSLVLKKIPSSGESLPIIGIGTARRYEEKIGIRPKVSSTRLSIGPAIKSARGPTRSWLFWDWA